MRGESRNGGFRPGEAMGGADESKSDDVACDAAALRRGASGIT